MGASSGRTGNLPRRGQKACGGFASSARLDHICPEDELTAGVPGHGASIGVYCPLTDSGEPPET
jgi:hypothetical protein